MMRKFKTLGVAVFAVLALSAVGVTAAQAAQFTSSAYPTTFTGTNANGNEVFTTEAGTVKCNSHFEGSISKESTTVTAHPTYTNCTAFGFLTATVTTGTAATGCNYVFHLVSGEKDTFNGNADLVCGAGTPAVTIVASTCEAVIHPQNALSNIKFINNTGAGDIEVDAEVVKSVNYTVTKDGIGCPFNTVKTPEAKKEASYESVVPATIDGTNNETLVID